MIHWSLPPCLVGIDDWALHRGRNYGTLVYALDRRRVIGLLPGRSSAPVRDWFAAHPSVNVISPDRSGPYAEAAQTDALTATARLDFGGDEEVRYLPGPVCVRRLYKHFGAFLHWPDREDNSFDAFPERAELLADDKSLRRILLVTIRPGIDDAK